MQMDVTRTGVGLFLEVRVQGSEDGRELLKLRRAQRRSESKDIEWSVARRPKQ